MEDKKLNEKESLELITRMIQNTQNKLEQGGGTPFLIWGYLTVIFTIAVWVALFYTSDYRWNLLWFVLPAVGWPLMLIFQKKKDKTPSTYIDRVVGYIWIVFSISFLIPSVMAFLTDLYTHLFFISLLMVGVAVAITGLVIRFRPAIIGGIISMLLSIPLLYNIEIGGIYCGHLIFALAFIVIMVIPGHILNYRGRKLKN